jgi:hypothetical protein
MSHEEAAKTLKMSVESVRCLLDSGEINACASDAGLVDSRSVEAFGIAERERVGKILQEMVTEAEDIGLYDIDPFRFVDEDLGLHLRSESADYSPSGLGSPGVRRRPLDSQRRRVGLV